MTEHDIPLSAIFGLEPVPGDDQAVTRESLRGACDLVRKAVARASGGAIVLRAFDLGPGVVADVAARLRTPLSGIVVNAWNKRKEIRKFKDTTQYPADETNLVWLYEHEFTQAIKPTVKIRYTGVELLALTFTGKAIITLNGAALRIRGGSITHVELGEVSAAVELSIGDLELVKQPIKTWKIPGAVALKNG